MKVLLINPPQTQPKESLKRCILPMGLAYIASYLELYDHDVKILDCIAEGYEKEEHHGDGQMTFGLSKCDIQKFIQGFSPDFVGVSSMMSSEEHNASNVCTWVKEVDSGIKVIVGGAHASAFSEFLIKEDDIDFVVFGEGEESMRKIVDGEVEPGVVYSELIDLDKLPWPARDLLPMRKYLEIDMPTSVFSVGDRVTQIETSRGCPFACCFCCTTHFWGRKWRARDPKKVVEEMKCLIKIFDINEFDVLDSNLVVDEKRMFEFCKLVKPLKIKWANPGGVWVGGLTKPLLKEMKESGCYQVTFAVENSDPYILKEVIHKPTKLSPVKGLVDYCHKIGIDTHAFFVLGFPEESVEGMKKTFKWAKKINFTSATFNIIQPLPGSEMWETHYKGKIKNMKDINLRKATIEHPEICKEDLEKMVDDFNYKFNRSVLWRHPKMFFKKYVRVALKRKDFRFIKKMFRRQ